MAIRSVYMYKCSMGYNNNIDKVAYCYARNSKVAQQQFKELYKEKKYDTFNTVMFGEANIKVHQQPFEIMSEDEVKYILKSKIGQEPMYAQRKPIDNPVPESDKQ